MILLLHFLVFNFLAFQLNVEFIFFSLSVLSVFQGPVNLLLNNNTWHFINLALRGAEVTVPVMQKGKLRFKGAKA